MNTDIANQDWAGCQIDVRIRSGRLWRVELWRLRPRMKGLPMEATLVCWVSCDEQTARARALELYRQTLEIVQLQEKGEETGQLDLIPVGPIE